MFNPHNESLDRNVHVLHLNVRSYLKNSDSFKLLLDDMLHQGNVVDVILMCKSFLTSENIGFAEIHGYKTYYKNRCDKPGGGIVIFIRNKWTVLDVMSTPFNSTTESLFLKLKIGRCTVIVGELYRIPNSNLQKFMDDFCTILTLFKNDKNVIIGSDHNLNLIKSEVHSVTGKFC